MPKINIDIHPDNFLPVYQHTINSDQDIEFLWGSRDSGKSRHVAQILVVLALAMPKMTCVLIRKVFNTIKDSQWQMIKEVAEEWNVDHLFNFKTSPLEITCVSGARLICRGLNDPKKLKSVTNPTHAWVEEGDAISENDWTLITTSLRSNNYRTQIWYTFNPDVPGIYTDFWLYKKYFLQNEPTLSFSYVTTEELVLDNGKVERVQLKIRATHSTWRDNPYCRPERKAYYLGLKRTSEYEWMVYCEGLWGTRKMGDEFFNRFDHTLHVGYYPYDPRFPLFASLDNNALPYCAVTFWQIISERDERGYKSYIARQVGEAPARPPDASPFGAAKMIIGFLKKIGYAGTGMQLGICGDRSTKTRSNIDPQKRSFFQIVNDEVIKYYPRTQDKFLSYAPPVDSIRSFVNHILAGQVAHLSIQIHSECRESINDYTITKTDMDGGILKRRFADYEDGPEYEHNGHLTDTAKDFIVQAFQADYEKFRANGNSLKPEGITLVSRTTNVTP